MKLKLDFDPDLVGMLKEEIKAGEHAVSAAMKEAGAELKTAWREQISSAGLGHRLPRTIRNRTYPKGTHDIERLGSITSIPLIEVRR